MSFIDYASLYGDITCGLGGAKVSSQGGLFHGHVTVVIPFLVLYLEEVSHCKHLSVVIHRAYQFKLRPAVGKM